jgi:MFS family permease
VPNVRLIIAAGLLVLFVDHGFTQWLPKMLENKGISSQAAGFTASIPLIAAVPAVFLVPRLSVRFPRGRFMAALAFLVVAALVITAIGPPRMLVAGLVLYGFSVPTLLPMLMLTLMNEPDVGAERMGLAGGLFFTIAELGGFVGPLTMGALVDATGGFLVGTLTLASAGIAFAVLMLFLRGHRQSWPAIQLVYASNWHLNNAIRIIHVLEVDMQKKLTITIDEEVYEGLRKIIGPRKISKFIEDLARPHVVHPNLESSYAEMAKDNEREREALEWAELTFKDSCNWNGVKYGGLTSIHQSAER